MEIRKLIVTPDLKDWNHVGSPDAQGVADISSATTSVIVHSYHANIYTVFSNIYF
jgi:hypothetical protein